MNNNQSKNPQRWSDWHTLEMNHNDQLTEVHMYCGKAQGHVQIPWWPPHTSHTVKGETTGCIGLSLTLPKLYLLLYLLTSCVGLYRQYTYLPLLSGSMDISGTAQCVCRTFRGICWLIKSACYFKGHETSGFTGTQHVNPKRYSNFAFLKLENVLAFTSFQLLLKHCSLDDGQEWLHHTWTLARLNISRTLSKTSVQYV